MNYQVTSDEATATADETEGAYLTWTGVELELDAGEHTLTYTIPAGLTGYSSWHWRMIYLVKHS